MNRLLILYIILQTVADFKDTSDTLRLVQVVFRHGERAPSETYPNDPHKNFKWPDGFWQLSNRGKQQLHSLGISLRQKYRKFLPEAYHSNDLWTISSYADRCHMSAQLVQLGLYPPSGDQIWNPDVIWQPIPVQTLAREQDSLVAIKKPCAKFNIELKKTLESNPALAKIMLAHAKVFEYLSDKSGQAVKTLRHIETLFNTLEIEELNNLTLPEWTKSVYPQPMMDLGKLSLASYTWTDELKKLHGGVLLKKLLNDMRSKSLDKLIPDNKAILYSGHDLTLMSIMRVFGIDAPKPYFGAAFIVELHRINNKNVVKIFYQANPYATAQEMDLTNCKKNGYCELETLTEVLRPITPENWEEDCKV